MSYFDYEKQLMGLLDSIKMQMLSRPLYLGGVAGSGGGSGGPPGGFIGYLPQTRISYDFDEYGLVDTPVSGASLLDNLNHIRFRIEQLEGGSGVAGQIAVYENGVEVSDAVTVIDFINAAVAETSPGVVEITVSGGGGTALTVKEVDGTPEVTDVSTIVVTNGTLTDDGAGQITLDFGSAATDGAAIHDNEAGEINAITEKTTPVDNDVILIEDSEDTYNKKKVLISNLPGGGTGTVLSGTMVYSGAWGINFVPNTVIFDSSADLDLFTFDAAGATIVADAPVSGLATNSMQFRNVTHDEFTYADITIDTPYGLDFSFDYKVSSELLYDIFDLFIDSSHKLQESGDIPWTHYAYTLTPGSHTIRWKYGKDVSDDGGSDTAWITNIVLSATPDVSYDFSNVVTHSGFYYINVSGVSYGEPGVSADWEILADPNSAPDTAKFVTTEANLSLENEIVIPGLAGSAEVASRFGDTLSEEFDSTSLSAWSWVSGQTPGTSLTLNANTTRPSHLTINYDDAGVGNKFYTRAVNIGTGFFDARWKVSIGNSYYQQAVRMGVYAATSDNTSRIEACMTYDATNHFWKASYQTFLSSTQTERAAINYFPPTAWFRIVRFIASTIVFVQISMDGYAWTSIGQYDPGSLDIQRIGFVINTPQYYSGQLSCDCVRVRT